MVTEGEALQHVNQIHIVVAVLNYIYKFIIFACTRNIVAATKCDGRKKKSSI